MARLARISVPGHPYHVVQRGNNRQDIFVSAADREVMRDLLAENARQNEVAIHAYVLMDNHFHLLATPQTEQSLPRMMQAVGRRYVRYFNDTQGRSGTLWEGRYKSALVQANPYLLTCMVYLDLNPVRVGMVSQALDYRWSSHSHYVGAHSDRLITPHALFWQLGNTPFAREQAYRELVAAGVPEERQIALRQSTASGWVLGEPAFVAQLQSRTERRLSKAAPGRPAKRIPGV